jgi:hypothetical protein
VTTGFDPTNTLSVLLLYQAPPTLELIGPDGTTVLESSASLAAF